MDRILILGLITAIIFVAWKFFNEPEEIKPRLKLNSAKLDPSDLSTEEISRLELESIKSTLSTISNNSKDSSVLESKDTNTDVDDIQNVSLTSDISLSDLD